MNAKPSRSARLARQGLLVSIIAGSSALAGCTTLGTNVNGSFRCEGPEGVCAPSTVIDDGALAEIQQVSSTELLSPAGPYTIDDGENPVPGTLIASAAGETVSRPEETFRLRVVFPAFVDARGQLHERSSVQTDARLPGRGDAVDALALRGSGSSTGRGLLAAAESAPPYLAIVSPAASAEAAAMTTDATGTQLASGPSPVDRIRRDVEAALSSDRPRRQAASFPGTPE